MLMLMLILMKDHFSVCLSWMNLSFVTDFIDAELNTNYTKIQSLPTPKMSKPLI